MRSIQIILFLTGPFGASENALFGTCGPTDNIALRFEQNRVTLQLIPKVVLRVERPGAKVMEHLTYETLIYRAVPRSDCMGERNSTQNPTYKALSELWDSWLNPALTVAMLMVSVSIHNSTAGAQPIH